MSWIHSLLYGACLFYWSKRPGIYLLRIFSNLGNICTSFASLQELIDIRIRIFILRYIKLCFALCVQLEDAVKMFDLVICFIRLNILYFKRSYLFYSSLRKSVLFVAVFGIQLYCASSPMNAQNNGPSSWLNLKICRNAAAQRLER